MTDIRRIDMRKIRDVLRLHLKGGLSQRQIAAALGISKGVVAKYISLATQLGFSWDDNSSISVRYTHIDSDSISCSVVISRYQSDTLKTCRALLDRML